MNQEEISAACKIVFKALKDDPGYWQSWKANIAMAFQDEVYRQLISNGIHKISNDAAENFLQKLTYNVDKEKCPPHSWDRSGERCEKCGDKDWMT